MVDFRLGRLENTAPVHESKFGKRVGFILPPGVPQEARVASGGCFLLVFAENVVRVVDFRLGRLENTAPAHESKLRKRVDFYFGPVELNQQTLMARSLHWLMLCAIWKNIIYGNVDVANRLMLESAVANRCLRPNGYGKDIDAIYIILY